jgi:hypothetical protein
LKEWFLFLETLKERGTKNPSNLQGRWLDRLNSLEGEPFQFATHVKLMPPTWLRTRECGLQYISEGTIAGETKEVVKKCHHTAMDKSRAVTLVRDGDLWPCLGEAVKATLLVEMDVPSPQSTIREAVE